ncbi:MAG: hypothetical protein JRN12_02785 [Nitrososphaerota archaeon]|jgi:hypothetical protein|nr:hypothetical protein [Nitrososphaerota archaeon]MDG6943035.1 hypothetical protein [Nitrososphaerota archaeon]MDG6950764.1 hypothetical protein [Nitrososphaerota archaeon]
MKLGAKAATYGLAGLALAGAVIFSGSALGLLGTDSSGALSILLTDPPAVPAGVTGVYITYSGLAVHAAGFGSSGWVSISGHGTFDSMKLVNLSQTISSDTVPSITYDEMEFTITAATVEFMGQNHSATISSGRLNVPIIGDLNVNSTSPAAALVDVQPTVINLGIPSNPSFTLVVGAKALQVPSREVDQLSKGLGQNTSLEGHGWFTSFKANYSDNLSSSAAALTYGSFSITVLNSGRNPITVCMFVVATHANGGEDSALSAGADSIVFVAQPNGSLQLLNGPPGQVQSYLEGPGYTLAGGSSYEFSYSGNITSLNGGYTPAAGASYYVVIVGAGTISAQVVTAT